MSTEIIEDGATRRTSRIPLFGLGEKTARGSSSAPLRQGKINNSKDLTADISP